MHQISSALLLVAFLLVGTGVGASEPSFIYPADPGCNCAPGMGPGLGIDPGPIPPHRPNCPPPELNPCLPPMYAPPPPHYPLCEECHWMWPNPLAWCRKVYGTSANRPMFAPWIENPCGTVDCDFVRPLPEPIVRRYVVNGDALFLFRDEPDLDMFTTVFDADIASTNGIDMGTAPRLQVIVPIAERTDFEAVYFGLDSWNVTANYDLAGGDVGSLDFHSSFHSGELNSRYNLYPWLTLLSGPRYIEFTETLDFTAPSVGLDATWRAEARNFLYGWQWGVDIGLLRMFDIFELTTVLKAGIFDDRTLLEQRVQTIGATTTLENKFDNFAFVGEAMFGGIVRLSEHSALRGGYQVLWLQDVSQVTNTFVSEEGQDRLVFHGGYAGIELRF